MARSPLLYEPHPVGVPFPIPIPYPFPIMIPSPKLFGQGDGPD